MTTTNPTPTTLPTGHSFDLLCRGGRTGTKVHRGSLGSSVLGCGTWVRANVGVWRVTTTPARANLCERCFGPDVTDERIEALRAGVARVSERVAEYVAITLNAVVGLAKLGAAQVQSADLYAAVCAAADLVDPAVDIDITSDGAIVIVSGERRAAGPEWVVVSQGHITEAHSGLAALCTILDAVGDLAYLVGRYGIDHRPVDGLSRLHDEFVSGLDLIVGRFDPAAGPRSHQVAPVSADALYEAAALAAEGFKGDAHRRITRGVPIPTDLRLLADTADLVYDLTNEYFSHPDVVSGAHQRAIGL